MVVAPTSSRNGLTLPASLDPMNRPRAIAPKKETMSSAAAPALVPMMSTRYPAPQAPIDHSAPTDGMNAAQKNQ